MLEEKILRDILPQFTIMTDDKDKLLSDLARKNRFIKVGELTRNTIFITPEELDRELHDKDGPFFYDVREMSEHKIGELLESIVFITKIGIGMRYLLPDEEIHYSTIVVTPSKTYVKYYEYEGRQLGKHIAKIQFNTSSSAPDLSLDVENKTFIIHSQYNDKLWWKMIDGVPIMTTKFNVDDHFTTSLTDLYYTQQDKLKIFLVKRGE